MHEQRARGRTVAVFSLWLTTREVDTGLGLDVNRGGGARNPKWCREEPRPNQGDGERRLWSPEEKCRGVTQGETPREARSRAGRETRPTPYQRHRCERTRQSTSPEVKCRGERR